MEKVFEDYLSELQSDIVALTLEYAEKIIDYIYIYMSCESNMYDFNVFYKVNQKVLQKSKLNNADNAFVYNTSTERQFALLDEGSNDLEKIHDLFKQYDREMPTEIRLIYDVKKNSLDAEYSYEFKYSNAQDLTPYHIFNQWFEEVAKENGQK